MLELGTGHGRTATLLARGVPGGRVVGVDRPEDILESARRRAQRERVADRVDCAVASFDAHFDGIVERVKE